MTKEEITDAELLNRFNATGDEDAFRVLVDKYLGLVFGVALRRTGQHSHAEEIAQNVFIVLAKKANRLKPTPSLYRCTLIEVAELGRRNRAHERKMKAFGEQVEPTGGRDIWNEVLPLLDESIHSLPAVERALILLRFFEQKASAREPWTD